MKIIYLLLVLVTLFLFNACDSTLSITKSNQVTPTVTPSSTATPYNIPLQLGPGKLEPNGANTSKENEWDGNEIIKCSPKKVYKGESFKVLFKKGHGKNFAIYNKKTRHFYFLTETSPYFYPYLSTDKFKELLEIEFNTKEVRSSGEDLEVDENGEYISKPFFSKTGFYRIIVGHQALDVDFIDMPITGMCEIYYVNKKRPKSK